MHEHVERVGVVVVSRKLSVLGANAVAREALLDDEGELLVVLHRVARRAAKCLGAGGVGALRELQVGGTAWDLRVTRLQAPAGGLLLAARALRAGAISYVAPDSVDAAVARGFACATTEATRASGGRACVARRSDGEPNHPGDVAFARSTPARVGPGTP